MALFGQQPRKDDPVLKFEPRGEPPVERPPLPPPSQPGPGRPVEDRPMARTTPTDAESILAAGLTIEPGAAINGEVEADTVLVGGEVHGQIVSYGRVEFKESGTLIGDLKAGSLTVAAGSKMRGKVEFGWKEGEVEHAASFERDAGHSN